LAFCFQLNELPELYVERAMGIEHVEQPIAPRYKQAKTDVALTRV
jgi:hypothetical protein